MKKKILSACLALCLLLTLLPTLAFAAEETCVAKIGQTEYATLAAAIEAANVTEGDGAVTVTILKDGTYDPFTIGRSNITIEAASDVNAVIVVNEVPPNNTANKDRYQNAKIMRTTGSNKDPLTGVTLRGIKFQFEKSNNFVPGDSISILHYLYLDKLTLDGCYFIGPKDQADGTALYLHFPNITVTDCTFTNWNRGYYTCGDNHAAGNITFTGNTFTNVRVPFDGYWGLAATEDTDITITENMIDAGSWGTAYIQLWDYAQYQHWLNTTSEGEAGHKTGGATALKGTVENNTVTGGELVYYATHADWYSETAIEWGNDIKPTYRNFIEIPQSENVDKVEITLKGGSPVTAFNDSTEWRTITYTKKNDAGQNVKYEVGKCIYSLSEGNYTVKVTYKADEGSDAVVTSIPLEVKTPDPSAVGDTMQKLEIKPLTNDQKNVAKVGDTSYTSLADAIKAAMDSETDKTVELLQDIAVDEEVFIKNMSGLTIDGAGHSITASANFHAHSETGQNNLMKVENSDNVIIKNLTLKTTEKSKHALDVWGSDNLTLENVTLDHSVAQGGAPLIINNSTVTAQGDFTVITGPNSWYGINVDNKVEDGEAWINFADGVNVTYNNQSGKSDMPLVWVEPKHDNVVTDAEAAVQNPENAGLVLGENGQYVEKTPEPVDPQPPVNPSKPGSQVDHSIIVDAGKNGTVKVSPRLADKGDKVTVTVTPDKGYVLDKLTVTDRNGKKVDVKATGDGVYTFIMPGTRTTVTATFKKLAVNPFVDVSKSDYYYDAVLWAVENGITDGTSATTFSPDKSCTRAEMVTFLWRAAGSPVVSGRNPFTDVSKSAYYYDAVLWAVKNGITDGTSATTFSPDAVVTRGQTATFLYRAAGSPAVKGGSFADVPATAYYADAVAWAVKNDITNGMGNGFQPDAPCTRAQIVTFLYRAEA